MEPRHRLSTVIGMLFVFSCHTSSAQTEPGLVVEEVKPRSSGEAVDLRAGDVLTDWTRGSAQGDFGSPFHFFAVQMEQGPRGAVMLRGRRGAEFRTWELRPGEWGLSTRPNLDANLRQEYDLGRQLAASGKSGEAAAAWRKASSGSLTPPLVSLWLLWQAGNEYAAIRDWQNTDACFRLALEHAVREAPLISARLHWTWASWFAARGNQQEAANQYQLFLLDSQTDNLESLSVAAGAYSLGLLAFDRGDLTEAEKRYQEAFSLREKLAPNSGELAAILNNLGIVARNRGELETAERFYRRSLAIRQTLEPDSLAVGESLNNLGNLVQDRGELREAEQLFERALVLKQKHAPGSLTVASTLGNLGNASYYRGNLEQSEQHFREALALFEKLAPGSRRVAATLHNLGNVIEYRGDLVRAERYLRQALAIEEKLAPDSLGVAETDDSLGALALATGKMADADQYFQRAFRIHEKLAPESLNTATVLKNLGSVSLRRGTSPEAEQYYQRALRLEEKVAPDSINLAETCRLLGKVAETTDDTAKAEAYYRRARSILDRLAPGSGNQAEVLYALARLLQRKQEFPASEQTFELAIAALEKQTTRLGGPEEVRASFRAEHADYYRDYLELLLHRNQPERAFAVQERSRARSLLALLAERDLVFSDDLPSELERERKQAASRYDRVLQELSELNPAKDFKRIDELTAELRELDGERTRLRETAKQRLPQLASLRYPEPLDLSQTRQSLDAGTLLLSYSVGARETSLFVVEASGAEPGFSVSRLPVGDSDLRAQIQEFRRLVQRPNDLADRTALRVRSRSLYDLLLKPVEDRVGAATRVLLLADGPLYALPFGALLRNDTEYVAQWKPIHSVVSATLYAELKRSRRDRQTDAVDLIAFGNPVFAKANPTATSKGLPDNPPLLPLRFSLQEVKSISALFPEASRVYVGPQATEERAKGLRDPVRYIHFATHSVLDEKFPLNSALVLTTPDRPNPGRDNGLLQAWEIFEQVRWNADLVVLSACETGLGKEVRNEGLIGLVRSLHYAGARSVLASLWAVEDRRTARLMQRFYTHLHEGAAKDEALRAAQMDLIRSASHPFYWAAFSLIGDWR